MGLIRKELRVRGDKGEATVGVLFDTGASASFISREIAERIATLIPWPEGRGFRLGDGETRIVAREATLLDLFVEGNALTGAFWIMDQLGEEVIIGADFLQRWKIKLEPETEEFILDPRALEMWLI